MIFRWIYDFYSLGFGEPIMVSAALALNIGDLLDKLIDTFQKQEVLNMMMR